MKKAVTKRTGEKNISSEAEKETKTAAAEILEGKEAVKATETTAAEKVAKTEGILADEESVKEIETAAAEKGVKAAEILEGKKAVKETETTAVEKGAKTEEILAGKEAVKETETAAAEKGVKAAEILANKEAVKETETAMAEKDVKAAEILEGKEAVKATETTATEKGARTEGILANKETVKETETTAAEKGTKTAEIIPGKEAKKDEADAETEKAGEEMKTAKAREEDSIFQRRLERHHDELRWLYMELYKNPSMFAELCDNLKRFYDERNGELKCQDLEREQNPEWYKQNDMLGMMFYIDNFAGNMKGVEEKLDYLERSNVNYLHLMPFLETPEGRSDGGYAVADFRKVQEKLGTMEDLESLTAACHKKHMNVCMDFVMNHTSEDHEWAKRARRGEGEYMSRYFFYNSYEIPEMYERTVPQVFPTTAPGNFTWLPDAGHYVMTTFYPYQWDLNYRNPRVFNEMMYNFMYLANRGIDIIRIDAVPYIWKELNTQCRNLKQVHTIVRMMRIISEIVCPGVLLLGEVVMEPEKVVPYFGTVEKPECHMLYNVTTMATTWHTVATRDVGLLKKQLDIVNGLPKEYTFLNYLRCHDDIGWGLDYGTLLTEGKGERPHKEYLNNYFQGYAGASNSRGELYNADPVTGDARFCGTTASMCGVEKAGFEQDEEAMERAIRLDVMLHAYMFMQSGIPVLYSGDEVGQVNDYTYKEDPHKAEDSRYIHRGAMNWELAAKIDDPSSVEGRIFGRLDQLEKIRKTEKAFVCQADTWTIDTWDSSVLCIGRYYEGEKIIGIFNFSEYDKTAWINETDGDYIDMISGQTMKASGVNIPAYGFYWLKKSEGAEKQRLITI